MKKNTFEYTSNFQKNDHLGTLFGCKLISVTEEECIYEYEVSKQHFNPNGTLHGGTLFSVMDTSQGAFIHYILEDKYKFAATGTASIRYLAPVTKGKIKIRTWLKEKAKRKYIILSSAINEEGSEVATLEEIWIAILK
jgi:uncharacterized protein (TIGR00369 family)